MSQLKPTLNGTTERDLLMVLEVLNLGGKAPLFYSFYERRENMPQSGDNAFLSCTSDGAWWLVLPRGLTAYQRRTIEQMAGVKIEML